MTDYTDLIARLRGLACLSGHEEIAEAVDALEAQARRIAGYQKDADDYLIRLDELNALRARIAELEAALREAYEVYAGSDGFIPETAAEGYLQQLISEMVDIIGATLGKKNESL